MTADHGMSAKNTPAGEPNVIYLSPLLGSDVAGLVNHLVAADPRFMVLAAPAAAGSYNYADDEVLGELIRQGARGAYWDILQKR